MRGRISELLFVHVVRRYVAARPPDRAGWLAGLRDPLVGSALGALHAEPARVWNLADLAQAVGTSRTVLAERVGYASEAAFSRAFKKHTGSSPGVWRTNDAARTGT